MTGREGFGRGLVRAWLQVDQEHFEDYLNLFTDKELGEGPVRLLVEGK